MLKSNWMGGGMSGSHAGGFPMWLFGSSPKKVVSQLSSTKAEERRKASQKLVELSKKKAEDLVPYLTDIVPRLADPDPIVRGNVIEALINIAQASPGTALSAALPLLQSLVQGGGGDNLIATIMKMLLG